MVTALVFYYYLIHSAVPEYSTSYYIKFQHKHTLFFLLAQLCLGWGNLASANHAEVILCFPTGKHSQLAIQGRPIHIFFQATTKCKYEHFFETGVFDYFSPSAKTQRASNDVEIAFVACK
jgi:hypothetical protein